MALFEHESKMSRKKVHGNGMVAFGLNAEKADKDDMPLWKRIVYVFMGVAAIEMCLCRHHII
jgi:hypothetical protein